MGPYNVRDLLRLFCIPGVGPQKFRALVNHFADPARVLSASPRELIRVPKIERSLASLIARHDGSAFADDQLKRLNRTGGEIISIWDSRYPELLKRIYDPPVILFVLGSVLPEDERSVAVVGTRSPSAYGLRVTADIASGLVRAGATVVSGLARGIDTAAHAEALSAGGRTIAVIGSGLDVPYPPENRRLLSRIADRGAILTEFAMGEKPDPAYFPRRNRIISGVSRGTVVVESAIDGGAMITASAALDQNREVFAVPGPLTNPLSVGPHTLIRDGRAKLITGVEDILTEFRGVFSPAADVPKHVPQNLTLFERTVLDAIDGDPVHIDVIAERSRLGPGDALVALLGLEFKGCVRQLPGKYFVRI